MGILNLESGETERSKSEGPNLLGLVVGGATAAATVLTLQLIPLETRMHIWVGMEAGLLVGLVPFFVARKRRRPKLAVLSLLACAIAGAALGLFLAIPTAIALMVPALTKRPKPAGVPDVTAPPA